MPFERVKKTSDRAYKNSRKLRVIILLLTGFIFVALQPYW